MKIAFGFFAFFLAAHVGNTWADGTNRIWNREELYRTPTTFDAGAYATNANGVHALFYAGEPYRGKPTRVFAYYGVPAHKPGEKVPGMVLVHGGGGSAFVRWVKLWNSRGYAAISMDTCGCVSGNAFGNEQRQHQRHAWGGPQGWGGFNQIDEPITDQWTYHAVAAAVRGHSLLRSLPEVDATRIGLTGISWGGYLTCIIAGVDDRFAFAVPVYGCGYLNGPSIETGWMKAFQQLGTAKAAKWFSLWDPSVYLPAARCPFLWIDGSNDFAYPLDSLQKSYRLPKGPRTLCIRLRMQHTHGKPSESPAEIFAFADACLRGGAPLPAWGAVTRSGTRVTARFTPNPSHPATQAWLNVTADTGRWQKRVWTALPAKLDMAHSSVEAELPPQTTVYYLNLETADNLMISTPHEEIKR